jgi:hypothetical protein
MRRALGSVSAVFLFALLTGLALEPGAEAQRDEVGDTSRYFAFLDVTSQPFVAGLLDSHSQVAWSGSPSPPVDWSAENSMPIAASFSVAQSSAVKLKPSGGDAYSRIGILNRGVTLKFIGRIAAPLPDSARVTFSIVDAKALAVNLFRRAGPVGTVDDLAQALQKGPGAALALELRREIASALAGESKVVFVKHISSILKQFGASRANRKWLLDHLGKNVTSALALATWAADVARAAGAYAGLAAIGTGGTETATLYSKPISATGAEDTISLVSWAAAVNPDRSLALSMVIRGGGGLGDQNSYSQANYNFQCVDPASGAYAGSLSGSLNSTNAAGTQGEVRSYRMLFPSAQFNGIRGTCHSVWVLLAGVDRSQQNLQTEDDLKAAGFYLTFTLP